MLKYYFDLLMYQVEFWMIPQESNSRKNDPIMNVDGTPMMGAFDMNGNAYGFTSSASMFNTD